MTYWAARNSNAAAICKRPSGQGLRVIEVFFPTAAVTRAVEAFAPSGCRRRCVAL